MTPATKQHLLNGVFRAGFIQRRLLAGGFNPRRAESGLSDQFGKVQHFQQNNNPLKGVVRAGFIRGYFAGRLRPGDLIPPSRF